MKVAGLCQGAHRNLYLPPSVNFLTATAEQLFQHLQNQPITSVHLVKKNARRYELENVQGLDLHAIINLVPFETLLETAETRDAERTASKIRNPLHGIPIVVKGNMLTDPSLRVPTTSGSYAFSSITASRDAFIITRAKDAGAIILGKANSGARLPPPEVLFLFDKNIIMLTFTVGAE
ncbi:hypothetical protein BBP40_006749 [Aspergillus hancockii]|nr:hypothetical protein BBP40_006749 [Aspergillus hancockii]